MIWPIPTHDFGTYGCLNIAKKWDLPYEVPLHIVHMYVFEEQLPGHAAAMAPVMDKVWLMDLDSDCRAVARQTIAQRKLADERWRRGDMDWTPDDEEAKS